MISNHSNSRRRVLTIFNHSLELCDKLINCFTFLFTPIPEFESFKRSVFPRSTIIFEFLQHQVKLLFIFLGSKFKGVTDFRAVFPMQWKKSPLAFLHLAARLRSLSNTVQIIASNASNSRLISFQTQSTRGLKLVHRFSLYGYHLITFIVVNSTSATTMAALNSTSTS